MAGSEPPDRARGGLFLGDRDFARFMIGQTISQAGAHITTTAIALTAIVVLNAGATEVGLLSSLAALPGLIVGLPAGVWVDRLPRRRVMVAADLARAAFLIVVPAAAALGFLGVGHLYVVGFLIGCLTVIFDVAKEAFVPSLVAGPRLIEANSRVSVAESIAETGGQASAGFLVELLTAPLALLADAATYVVSAVLLLRIRDREAMPARTRAPVIEEIVAGLRAVTERRPLRALALAAGLFAFFGGHVAALYGLYVVRDLGMRPAALGLLIASGGLGSIIGAAVTPRLSGRVEAGVLAGWALMAAACVGLLIPLASMLRGLAFPVLLLNQVAGDVAFAVFLVASLTARQRGAPADLLGRVNATMGFVTAGALPLGMLAGGLLGDLLGRPPTLILAFAGIFGTGAMLRLSADRERPPPA